MISIQKKNSQNCKLNPRYLYGIFIFSCLLLFSYVSLNNFISHSEFWSIASAKLFGSSAYSATHLYYKSLFHALLKFVYSFNLENINHILISRLFFGWIAFLCFYLFLIEILRITKDYHSTLIFGLFLLSFQIYFYNIYRVRSDLLASLFIILSFKIINDQYYKKRLRLNFTLTLPLTLLMAFLSTPKSLYLIIIMLTYHVSLNREAKILNTQSKKIILILFLLINFIFLSSMLATNLNILFDNPYALALYYHIQSFQNFNAMGTWAHLLISLKINPFHYGLILFGSITFIFMRSNQDKRLNQSLLLISVLSLLTILIHPDKWTYFIAQFIPFLSLPILSILLKVERNLYKTILSALLIISPLLTTNHHSWFHTNKKQLQAIQELQTIFDQIPHSTYFDSTGLLPKRNGLMSFLGPNDPLSKSYLLDNLSLKKPEFIFFTTKLQLANPEITPFLYSNYVEIKTDVWVLNEKKDFLNLKTVGSMGSLQSLFIFDYEPYLKY